MAFEAMNILAGRYSKLAAEMAEAESDPVRKAELQTISETCARVPMEPPRTFREAIQCFWFQFLMLSPSTTLPGGRFDQYMYPLLRRRPGGGPHHPGGGCGAPLLHAPEGHGAQPHLR